MKKLTKKTRQNEGTLEAYACSCYACNCSAAPSKSASYFVELANYARMSTAING